jgi:hypothetical protein
MGGFTSRPMIDIPLMPIVRPTWIEHLEPGTHYSSSNFSEETLDYRIRYGCQNNECHAEVFDKKLNKGMVFVIKDGKCFYNNKQISKTALLAIAHKESLTPLVNLLVQHAGFELPSQYHSEHKIENGTKSTKKSGSSKSSKRTHSLQSSNSSSQRNKSKGSQKRRSDIE